MNNVPFEIEKLISSIAIGSICCFGLFLILDSINSTFFHFFEIYVQTESFGVIAAIPTLALLYIVGVLISTISDLIFQILRPKKWSKEWQVMGYVINSQNSALVSTFFEMHRKKKNIEGSIFPLCILGLGIYLEHTNLPDLRSPLILASASVIAISLLLPLFSNRIQKDINQLVEIAKAAE